MTEQDEIRRLKELIAKQQLQLAEKDEIIRKQNIRIENMTQALLHAKKKIFGRSSGKRSKTRRSDTVPILRYDIRSLFI